MERIGRPIYYATAPSANTLVYTGKCVLERIIIGADVATSSIVIGDDRSAAATNTVISITGSTLMTSKAGDDLGIEFQNGICVTVTNQTKITFVIRPIN